MNPELMKAILAMDSYNRGYGAGLGDAEVGLGVTGAIGSAKILPIPLPQDSKNVGFYAIAYEYNGEKIISYRGTDSGLDNIYGWPVGGGMVSGPQALMAFEFYKEVAGGVDPRAANISLTGHSMGGGHAGLVGSVYGKSAVIFDNMAYKTAAENVYDYATTRIAPVIIGGTVDDSAEQNRLKFKSIVYGDGTPWDVTNDAQVSGNYMYGEALSLAFIPGDRTGQNPYTLGDGWSPGSYGIDPFDLHLCYKMD